MIGLQMENGSKLAVNACMCVFDIPVPILTHRSTGLDHSRENYPVQPK